MQPDLWTFVPDKRRDAERLVPVALELAERAGRSGVTVADLRLAAVQRGLLTGRETGRRLSFLGGVMRKAGLVGTAEFRRSAIVKAHGNLNRVWIHPKHAGEAAA